MQAKPHILPILVLAQFFCSSVWFAVNAVLLDLSTFFGNEEMLLSQLTISIQLGFIVGTLLFSWFAFADRHSPSKVFFVSSLLAAAFNLAILFPHQNSFVLLFWRLATGFFLAGIYPVGMKIASDHFGKELGKSLGFLVGALVLGTALPHLIKSLSLDFSWQWVIILTSLLSLIGGFLLRYSIPDGPFRVIGQSVKLSDSKHVFRNGKFRSAAFGYFGHMWELYTFWAYVPVILLYQIDNKGLEKINIPLASFGIIASGSLACVAAGYISRKFGLKNTAFAALLLSCICCLVSPLVLLHSGTMGLLVFLVFWAMVVIADSPLFSSLVALHAPPATKGSALTLVNCIGFALTILSIQTMTWLFPILESYAFLMLAFGPILGLFALGLPKKTQN